MDARSAASEPQHSYPPSPWTATSIVSAESISNGAAHSQSSESPPDATAHPVPAGSAGPFAQLDFLPFLFPQQNIYHAQLLHYNKLISPSRGGGLQTPPLPHVVSSPHVQAGPRSRSSSRVSLKDGSASKGAASGGNGNRSHHNSDKTNSPVVTPADTASKMPPKQSSEISRSVPQRSNAAASLTHGQSHSNSVPSTPHQHARQFSFESREPSPTAANNHSPRSAYSETSSTLPSLRPLPPRLGGCKYETAQINSRRRIPYSVGSDRLEKLDLRTVKNKLSEDEERKLTTDMREIYNRLLPTDKVEDNRKKLVQKLEKIFNDEWPGHDICVHLFGSSGNLLCSDDSDVDICITTSWQELEGVCMIADLLARRGMEKVVCISAAKVPIVKIWDPELGLACDMNVNNTLALENTRMVRIYVEADPRVRQLAMIIKYWTRRRIINDAAFGGTLSSYTWICLIIAFLQLRTPPVLPALHQMPYKMPRSDGTASDFADNLKKIKGYGNKNKSSVAELLFQFFRFYAHEFDYDKHVLTIRQGKLLTKQEKRWNYAVNNQLCVEEPFNISRNLGNTADEYAFRGVHLELRRAFDLLCEAKLDQACEQYVFPKEEERVWTRPAPQPRPVLLRSSSQTHSGRGGRGNHRGGRHNNNFHRGGGGSNRRASSSIPTYDPNMFVPLAMQQDMSWLHTPQYPFQYTQQDLMTQFAYQEQLRHFHNLYAQGPFLPHQVLGQQQQRLPVSLGSGQQPSERSRTNSFDNVPVTAPLRPDLYALYGVNLGHTFLSQNGYGSYPSTPATTSNHAAQDFRRSLQRTTISTEGGASTSSSSVRSQSQPARRSPSASAGAGYQPGGQTLTSATMSAPRHANGMAIPNFMPDDADFDETPKAVSGSPESVDTKSSGFFQTRGLSPTRPTQLQQPPAPPPPQQQQHLSNGIAFGDLGTSSSSPDRRRLSTDQLPQTLLDRRIRRASRSPSPLGHARAFSVGGASSAPSASAPFAGSQSSKVSSRPLVVNGSGLRTAHAVTPPGQTLRAETLGSDDSPATNMDNALHINTVPIWPAQSLVYPALQPLASRPAHQAPSPLPLDRPPIVVNGSSPPLSMPLCAEDASFKDRITLMNSIYLTRQLSQQEAPNGAAARLSPSARQRLMSRQPQSGVIAPLDLAIGDHRVAKPAGVEAVHLSPVYETRLPSPAALRKQEPAASAPTWPPNNKPLAKTETSKPPRMELSKETQHGHDQRNPSLFEADELQKGQKPCVAAGKSASQRENGHVRGAKSEGDGGWHKASGKGKKKAYNAVLTEPSQAELPPKNGSERKGG
ncbi:PAP/25A-associated [Metarhizium album ARSEF 1941]|uniref:polynucleotide adenylyltransferase n=1 Tax=Metarhizium album (strain ARSEF 1941) TaxID=1081103 RepID=A0A0B2X780_METAS|nr:PAP/25A-associated [Metarhizium album ARSEF 1941]KHO01335.1 PAP/25A-associated [Metarhizium album ARSEF 1941]